MGEVLYMVRDDWYAFECPECKEEIQLPDMWVLHIIRNDHTIICGCGYETSIPASCADSIEG